MRTVQQWKATLARNGHPVFAWVLVAPNGVGYEHFWLTEEDGVTPVPVETAADFRLVSRIDSIPVSRQHVTVGVEAVEAGND